MYGMCAKQYIGLWCERSKLFHHLFLLVFFSFTSCFDSAVSSIYLQCYVHLVFCLKSTKQNTNVAVA